MNDVALYIACLALIAGIAFVTYAVRVRARQGDES